jgi:hypothetical protein
MSYIAITANDLRNGPRALRNDVRIMTLVGVRAAWPESALPC